MVSPVLVIVTEYFGVATISYWEFSLMFVYVLGLYVFFSRQKQMRIAAEPEYAYFLWGLFAKILGGVFFSLIYFYYYNGGDTIGYFFSALPISKLAKENVFQALTVLFGANSVENQAYFTMETGKPLDFMYYDSRTYTVIRLIAPFIFISFDSYLITTTLVASFSYIGPWRGFQTLSHYFPSIRGKLAIAFLFMPSAVFWGSGLLKDTFTFSATCWSIHCVDSIFFRKRDLVSSSLALALSFYIILAIKPYIFMVLFPLILLWLFYQRLARIRNALIKFIILPAAFLSLVAGSFLVLQALGDRLDKFSLDNALDTIIISQQDMKRAEEYGSNYFDVGTMEHSWVSVLSKFPVATNAALFRPYLWECRNLVMTLAGLENLFLLVLAITLLLRSRVVFLFTMITKNPLVTICVTFTLLYGFITGITTPNFGALVRFKIPLLPFFVAGCYIMLHLLDLRSQAIRSGRPFFFEQYAKGEPVARPAGPSKRNRRKDR
ncbi:MAG: hypothetical protein JNM31_14460 [Flavobacteriales bacterium]|nr:hypothetical protein [Flavobacteriales bacterium]